MTVVSEASPSLALIKYWGKLPGRTNLPSTSSLAVTLGALTSRTTISDIHSSALAEDQADVVFVDGVRQSAQPFLPVIRAVRSRSAGSGPRSLRAASGGSDSPADATTHRPVRIESENDFPTAAGLASSSSGFAALAVGLDAFFGTALQPAELSAIARLGSGSAARAVFGGFTIWTAGSEHAQAIAPDNHWPDLHVLVVVLKRSRKPLSSRAGMERSRKTSPYYDSWVASSPMLYDDACAAVADRDLDRLGAAMRQSYLRMFGTMFTADPPFIYWLPESLAVIHRCEELRQSGVPVWETMDAGPQVKLLTLAAHSAAVTEAIIQAVPGATIISSEVGGGPVARVQDEP